MVNAARRSAEGKASVERLNLRSVCVAVIASLRWCCPRVELCKRCSVSLTGSAAANGVVAVVVAAAGCRVTVKRRNLSTCLTAVLVVVRRRCRCGRVVVFAPPARRSSKGATTRGLHSVVVPAVEGLLDVRLT